MTKTVGSVCSSVGGMDLGFARAGFETRWVCEVDPWRRKVLAKHFPDAKQYPDLTTLDPAALEPVAVLIGGTPCQDLSNAGKQAGIEGSRSRLFFDFIRVRNGLGVPWSVWENVAGALSSNGGLDFACVLGAHVGAPVAVPDGGWASSGVVSGPWGGATWRVLNAQYFGVPQRRRRVFVVGHLGGECSPEVLFESTRSSGDIETSGEARKGVAGSAVSGTLGARGKLGGNTTDIDRAGAYVADDVPYDEEREVIVGALDRQEGGPDDSSAQAGHLIPSIVSTLQAAKGRGHRIDAEGAAGGTSHRHRSRSRSTRRRIRLAEPWLQAFGASASIGVAAFAENERGEVRESEVALSLSASGGKPGQGYPAARVGSRVRRLTPTECERLMGWPDGWTVLDETDDPNPLPDSRRYAACGDGVVAPVAEWIARRLADQISSASTTSSR